MESVTLGVRKGVWTEEEDMLLKKCIQKYGEGKWHQVPLRSGLNRCRKSCRMRWLNYLRPNINRGNFTTDEVDLIIRLHKLLGNRWSLIAGRLPGRTSNDVKNYWNTHLQKKLIPKIPKTIVPKDTKAQPWTHPKSPPRSSPPCNNEILWCDNKIVGSQIDNIGIHWSIDGSIFEEPIWGNLQSAGDSFLQQNQSDWSDIFMEDVNLWNLLGDD